MQKENTIVPGSNTPGGLVGNYTWHLSLRVDRPVEVILIFNINTLPAIVRLHV